jgi:acyl-CoA oxidase
MTDRLKVVSQQVAKSETQKVAHISDALQYFHFDDLIPKDAVLLRHQLREWGNREVKKQIVPIIERAEFPIDLAKYLADTKLQRVYLNKPYGEGKNIWKLSMACLELAYVDGSLATMFLVNLALCSHTIDVYGSEEQKEKYLNKLTSYELMGGWALTEAELGSDASNLKTSVRKVEGGYLISGNKRWIGNANKDIVCVFARNTANKQVEGFIVDLKSPGVTVDIIKHKIALRGVQNG